MKLPEKPIWLAQGTEKVELAGNREATIDGCGGILEYTQEKICIRYGRGVLQFWGRGLSLHSLEAHSLVVSGYLTEIDYAVRRELLPQHRETEEGENP